MQKFQFIGGYDRRRNTSTISAQDAHAMVKATNKRTSDLSRKAAENIAVSYGLKLLGSKPRLVLMDGDAMVNTHPYKLICHRDVQIYCEQIHAQKLREELATRSNAEIITNAIVAKELIEA